MKQSILRLTFLFLASATMYNCSPKTIYLDSTTGVVLGIDENNQNKYWVCFSVDGDDVETGSQACEWFTFPEYMKLIKGSTLSIQPRDPIEPTPPIE